MAHTQVLLHVLVSLCSWSSHHLHNIPWSNICVFRHAYENVRVSWMIIQKNKRTTISINLVICRWERDLRIWISLCRFSKSLVVRLSRFTALIATWCRVSWRALVECHRTVCFERMHLMVSLINCRETPLPNIFDYDIRSSIVDIRVLVRGGRPFERLNCMGHWKPRNWGSWRSDPSIIESSSGFEPLVWLLVTLEDETRDSSCRWLNWFVSVAPSFQTRLTPSHSQSESVTASDLKAPKMDRQTVSFLTVVLLNLVWQYTTYWWARILVLLVLATSFLRKTWKSSG